MGLMKRLLIVHYSEIGLKLGNTSYFLGKLRNALKIRLEKKFRKTFSVIHVLKRFMICLPDDFDELEYSDVLQKIFGIKNFKFVYEGSVDVKKLGNQIWKNLPKYVFDKKPKSFRVKVKRSMILPCKSFEMERDLGAVLIDKGLDIKVNLTEPEFVVDVEFFDDHGYFSFKKYNGAGGLPSNSQSKLVSLLSAGFDSPVAAYQMMRRGARVIFVHFHGYPYTGKEEMEQVEDLVKILSGYQFDTKLYLVPYGKVQREIATNLDVPAKIRTVLYRRTMIRIAEEICKKEQAKGLVTGDNYGQVASQTPENIFAIHEASSVPIFTPLISFDKEDIIKIARKIGTHDVSMLPCKDTCTMFAPKTPELKANVRNVLEYEKKIDVEKLVTGALNGCEVKYFS
jgi:thiamine biosynthesis protein ThiI